MISVMAALVVGSFLWLASVVAAFAWARKAQLEERAACAAVCDRYAKERTAAKERMRAMGMDEEDDRIAWLGAAAVEAERCRNAIEQRSVAENDAGWGEP